MESVHVRVYEKIGIEWERSDTAVRIVGDVECSFSISELPFEPEKLPDQCHHLAQWPHKDIEKTRHDSVANFFAEKLRSNRKTSDAESS